MKETRGSRRRKGRVRMPGRHSTSLVCFAIHLGLFTASFGAAVDAPKTVTETVSVKGEGEGGEVTEQREGEGGGGRFPRSVGSDYQDSLDYPNKLTAYGAEDSGSRSRRRFSENQWKSGDEGEWELAAQVAKRGQRGRGEYYRGPAEEEVRSYKKTKDKRQKDKRHKHKKTQSPAEKEVRSRVRGKNQSPG